MFVCVCGEGVGEVSRVSKDMKQGGGLITDGPTWGISKLCGDHKNGTCAMTQIGGSICFLGYQHLLCSVS